MLKLLQLYSSGMTAVTAYSRLRRYTGYAKETWRLRRAVNTILIGETSPLQTHSSPLATDKLEK